MYKPMSKNAAIALVVVIIVIIGGIVCYTSSPSTAPAQSTAAGATTTAGSISQTITVLPAPTASSTKSFTVTGNDQSADLTTINVSKGDYVSITFKVDPADTYHGGLDFESPIYKTGTILPGASKTITFVASSSFVFTPYWPESNIKKPYTVNVVVS